MRQESMQPTPMRGRRDANLHQEVRTRLSPFADVRMPEDAPEPILGPSMRQALLEWLREISCAAELKAAKIKPRRTALLYGLPGTGKTTWAYHFAARLGLPLACVRSESLIDKYIGSTGRNIGDLFDAMARTEGNVVMFFDEVDAIGSKRMGDIGASQERANSLNVLLRRIEHFNGICLAATNREKLLDDALWRRFDMQVEIKLPEFEERWAIVRMYADPFEPCEEATNLLANLTASASPALIRMLIEGVKRTTIMWPKVRHGQPKSAADVFEVVVSSVSPAPEYQDCPPLWFETAKSLKRLASMQWPWPFKLKEDAG
jgi:hypothetical protein